MKRKLDIEIEVEEIRLWKIIGFDPIRRRIICANPENDNERFVFYTSTGAGGKVDKDEVYDVKEWGRDENNNQREFVTKRYKFIDP